MTAMQAIHKFWSGFELTAYDEYTVPDKAELPYITYEASEDYFGYPVASSASLWYHSPSWAEITKKADEISDYIGRGGRMVIFDGGSIWIKRGNPWAQRLNDSADNMLRRIVLNIEIEFIQ